MGVLARAIALWMAGVAAPASAQVADLPSAIPAPDALARARAGAGSSPERPPWRTPVVPIRLAPALADAAPDVRAEVMRLPLVTISEPADYQLTTLADYPNTLVIEPVTAPNTARETMAGMALPSRALGNLVLSDYAEPLAVAVGRIGWIRALIGLGETAAAPPTMCVVISTAGDTGQREPAPIRCELAGGLRDIDEHLQLSSLSPVPPQLSIAVRNEAAAPRYLYAVVIHQAYDTQVIALNGGAPVAPGAWAERRDGPLVTDDVAVVTIASATPLPDAVLSDHAFGLPAEACRGSLAQLLCGRASATTRAEDWSASIAYVSVGYRAPEAVGGALPLPSLSLAPFMAELYSTVPFTPEEIAADKAKPFGERLFLAERTAVERDHRCGGSLIAPDLVLTAAHCVARDDLAGPRSVLVLSRRRIRVGTLRLGAGGRTFAIDAVAVHAGYHSGQQLDDIALLHLRRDRGSVDDGETPAPIALPTRADAGLPDATPVDALGWGFTREVAPDARPSLTTSGAVQRNPTWLRDGSMQLLDWRTCRRRMGASLRGNMLCAVTRTGLRTLVPSLGTFSCLGDSGGPLVRDMGGRPVLVGVTSWSKGCSAAATNASVYTNVARYADWIAAAQASLVPGRVVLVDHAGGARVLALP